MAITYSIKGAAEVVRELRDVAPGIERFVLLGMSQAAYDAAQDGIRPHSKKGDLFGSLYNRSHQSGGREVGNDLSRAPHALFVHWGTRPHKIRPKKRKTLRWASGGKFIFAREVNHPGYKGDPYLIRAADAAVRRFDQIVNQATKQASGG